MTVNGTRCGAEYCVCVYVQQVNFQKYQTRIKIEASQIEIESAHQLCSYDRYKLSLARSQRNEDS